MQTVMNLVVFLRNSVPTNIYMTLQAVETFEGWVLKFCYFEVLLLLMLEKRISATIKSESKYLKIVSHFLVRRCWCASKPMCGNICWRKELIFFYLSFYFIRRNQVGVTLRTKYMGSLGITRFVDSCYCKRVLRLVPNVFSICFFYL